MILKQWQNIKNSLAYNMAHEKYIELAKKLKALADRGEGGERINAQKLLDKLMVKHGISMIDIEGELRKRYVFKFPRKHHKLFFQIAGHVINRSTEITYHKIRGGATMELSPNEAVEIQAKCDFYFKAYEKQLETFYSAFVQANELYPKPTGKAPQKERTPEEKEEVDRILNLARGIQKERFLLALTK